MTFWLRPAFVLRALNRFQRVAGFDRAIALASSALTALIPLTLIVGAILPRGDGTDVAHRIIARYGLTGGGAQAVIDALSPTPGTNTDVSILGAFLLVIAVLSFARGAQRLFEQTWELKPLSVRNTVNDLIWIGGLVCYTGLTWWIRDAASGGHTQVLGNLVVIPLTALFLGWTGRTLSAKRIEWRRILPFAVLGALLFAIAGIAAGVYLPHLFSSYASRFGVLGAVLAMISALFTLMLVLVASAAVGREVSDELDRIGRGERPPNDEVRREWDALLDQARLRWETLHERLDRLRRGKNHDR